MKNYIFKLPLCVLLAGFWISAFPLSAEARNFYKTSFNFGASYTNIRTGSKTLFTDSVRIVYSDDGDFCFLQENSEEVACKIISFDSQGEPVLNLPKDFIVKIFVKSIESENSATDEERAALRRLLQNIPWI